jgi:hypothetical protein
MSTAADPARVALLTPDRRFLKGAELDNLRYNPAATYATRKAQRLTGRVDSYITPLATPLNHVDAGYARNDTAGVADGGTTDKIQSMTFAGNGFRGTRLAMAWKAGVLTEDQLARIAVNAYKLVA